MPPDNTPPPNPPSTVIRVDTAESTAVVTLDGPRCSNAVDADSLRALTESLRDLSDDERVRAVVLTGAGTVFCGGANLARIADPADIMSAANDLIMAIRGLAVPVIAAVNGPAVGYGAGLVTAADIAIGDDTASLVLPFTELGLIPDGGLTYCLPARAGRHLASEMVLAGRTLSAAEAVQAGLLSRVVRADSLAATAHSIGEAIAARPRHAVGAAKQALAASESVPLAAALTLEARTQVEMFTNARVTHTHQRPQESHA